MRDRKKKEPIFPLDMEFGEALARLVQTNPKEITGALERVRQRQGEIRKNAEERKEAIKRGARPPGKAFRL